MPNLIIRLLNRDNVTSKELYTILKTSSSLDKKTGQFGLGKHAQHAHVNAALQFDEKAQTVTITDTAALYKAALNFSHGSAEYSIDANLTKSAILYALLIDAPQPANDANNYKKLALISLDELNKNKDFLKKKDFLTKQIREDIVKSTEARIKVEADAAAKIEIAEIAAAAAKAEADRVAAAAKIKAAKIAAETKIQNEAKRLAAIEAAKPENIVNTLLTKMQEKQTKAEQEAFFYAEINKINLKATTLLSTKMINIHNGIDSDAHFDIVRARTKLKFLGKQTNTKTWDRMRAAVQAQQTLLLSHVNNISYMLDEVETLQAAVSKFLSAMGKAGKSLPQAQRAAAEELYFINNLATLKPIELSALLMTMDEIQDDDLDDERFNNILAISPNSTISEAFKSTKAWDRMYDKVKELAPPTLNSHSTLNINKGKSNAPHATFNPKNIFVAMVDASAARQGLSAVKKSQSDYFMKLTKNLTETEKAQLHHYMEDVQNGKEKDANLDDVREKRNPLTRCFGDGKGNTATWSTMFKAVKPKKVEEKCETKQNIFRPLA